MRFDVAICKPPHRLVPLMVATMLLTVSHSSAQSPTAESFSEEVVAKADAVLEAAGLRRSGRILQSTDAAELSRRITGLSRQRRELKLLQKDLDAASAVVGELETMTKSLQQRDGELNLQLAAIVSGDVTANNRLVALINATRTQITQTRQRQAAVKANVEQKRGLVFDAEASYAEAVHQLRQRFDDLTKTLEQAFASPSMPIALRVVATNFQVPPDTDAAAVLRPIEQRLITIEQEVFSETLKLTVQPNGSLVITVSVNGQSIPMVVDSGATVVVLPSRLASKLGLTVPADAPIRNVVLANGQTIPARGLTLERVRVGQFETRDVEAIVLGEEAPGAEPLLGMSYLGRFKFEIDPAEQSLRMLRVASP